MSQFNINPNNTNTINNNTNHHALSISANNLMQQMHLIPRNRLSLMQMLNLKKLVSERNIEKGSVSELNQKPMKSIEFLVNEMKDEIARWSHQSQVFWTLKEVMSRETKWSMVSYMAYGFLFQYAKDIAKDPKIEMKPLGFDLIVDACKQFFETQDVAPLKEAVGRELFPGHFLFLFGKQADFSYEFLVFMWLLKIYPIGGADQKIALGLHEYPPLEFAFHDMIHSQFENGNLDKKRFVVSKEDEREILVRKAVLEILLDLKQYGGDKYHKAILGLFYVIHECETFFDLNRTDLGQLFKFDLSIIDSHCFGLHRLFQKKQSDEQTHFYYLERIRFLESAGFKEEVFSVEKLELYTGEDLVLKIQNCLMQLWKQAREALLEAPNFEEINAEYQQACKALNQSKDF